MRKFIMKVVCLVLCLDYYKFNHWKDCIIAYKEMIQYKYKDGDDYLNFLKKIGYAKDSEYICKLKELIKKNPP